MITTITIKNGKTASIARKHPWIFSGAIVPPNESIEDGSYIHFASSSGKILGTGHFFNGNIAIKVLHFGQEIHEEAWLVCRAITKAFELRRQLQCGNTYRLIHGEGDFLPGLIVDIFDQTAVVQCHSIGMHRLIKVIANELIQLGFKYIYDKSKNSLPANYAEHHEDQWIGEKNTEVVAQEYEVRYHIPVELGQKTGFFIDQRENRKLLGHYASGKNVLNTFCYTGGFSLMALLHGAIRVVSVDVSQKALDMLKKNIHLNQLVEKDHVSIAADVKHYLKESDEQFDIVILDPPAFAKNMKARHRAVQAYKRLNLSGMNKVKPGGLLFTFSCSQVVDTSLFEGAVTAAAIECGRSMRIIHYLSQGPDHPVNIYHPEGRYLKGLVLQLD